ncbi:hypothetical protein EYF80_064735 [Liparis tanakae]|uniref:Uncharacterized protein n=1 Tax=Liparis tanakae TaxID=230148 RepID=A0A4Z2E8K4_9TELE|nr:hypothetical protein EYF80_064735 [Liparis tanakae]
MLEIRHASFIPRTTTSRRGGNRFGTSGRQINPLKFRPDPPLVAACLQYTNGSAPPDLYDSCVLVRRRRRRPPPPADPLDRALLTEHTKEITWSRCGSLRKPARVVETLIVTHGVGVASRRPCVVT